MNKAKHPCLPLLKSMDEAVALSKKEKDPFYIAALQIQLWLALLQEELAAEYAGKKNARERSPQTGRAWRLFGHVFGELPDGLFFYIFKSMVRLTAYDDPVSSSLADAIFPLTIEHECSGDYLGPKTPDFSGRPAEMVQLLRRTVERWCDWIEAAGHLHIQLMWHHAPVAFDPDAEKRALAALGLVQRRFAEQNDWVKSSWQHMHAELAQKFEQSPKWPTVGKAMASEQQRPWTYQEVDTLIITLWPLVKRHNWTYSDLLHVVRSLCQRPDAYPCEAEQGFATYCTGILGLRKTVHGKTTPSGRPPGYEVAHGLFRRQSKG